MNAGLTFCFLICYLMCLFTPTMWKTDLVSGTTEPRIFKLRLPGTVFTQACNVSDAGSNARLKRGLHL